MEYVYGSLRYLREKTDKIKEYPYIGKLYSYIGNVLLYIYITTKTNYPIAVYKINSSFMCMLKWFVQKKLNGDYSQNQFVKYIYEKFNNDDEYIEYVKYKPVLEMDTKIVNSDVLLGHKNIMDYKNAFKFNIGLTNYSDSLVVFHKIVKNIQYHRIFSSSSWDSWIQQNKESSLNPVSTQNRTSKVFKEFEIVSSPFIFIELVYESMDGDWVTVMLYENIKRICVKGNVINHDSLQYVCMKYHHLNLNKINYKLNVLFPKTESIDEYTRDQLNTDPIVIS